MESTTALGGFWRGRIQYIEEGIVLCLGHWKDYNSPAFC